MTKFLLFLLLPIVCLGHPYVTVGSSSVDDIVAPVSPTLGVGYRTHLGKHGWDFSTQMSTLILVTDFSTQLCYVYYPTAKGFYTGVGLGVRKCYEEVLLPGPYGGGGRWHGTQAFGTTKIGYESSSRLFVELGGSHPLHRVDRFSPSFELKLGFRFK